MPNAAGASAAAADIRIPAVTVLAGGYAFREDDVPAIRLAAARTMPETLPGRRTSASPGCARRFPCREAGMMR
ncbi:MAG TPA: hypothetical protein ENN09_07620 [Planctomycetes bacterium]|nr:hypothetical protein [Planctomycetota bacterium]